MARPDNAMQVFNLLDKSNCRQCGEKTCLAFAGAVFQQRRSILECPTLDPAAARQFLPDGEEGPGGGEGLDELKQQITQCDLEQAAGRTGGSFDGQKLTIKILGKDFSVDHQGNFYSEIHIHTWITIPMLNYIIQGAGKEPVGEWISFRELKGAQDWYNFFVHQCEKPLKKVAATKGPPNFRCSRTKRFEKCISFFEINIIHNQVYRSTDDNTSPFNAS